MNRSLIAPVRLTLFMIAALLPILSAGCGGDEKSIGPTVVQELRGDTVVMVSSGEPERVRIDEVEVFWQSDGFGGGALSRMIRLGDNMVIGDSRRIHVISLQDGSSHTFGQAGEGPGEIQRAIWSVGGFGTDTLAVHDVVQVLLFSLDGEFISAHRTTPQFPFNEFVTGGNSGADRPVYPLVRSGGGVLWERAALDRRPDGTWTRQKALVWHDLEADTAAVLEVWDYQGGTGQGPVFGDLVKHVIATDGRVATGYPDEYCIRLSHAFEEGVRTGCRARSRVPVAAGFNALSGLERFGAYALDQVAQQLDEDPVDLLPHFDRLLFSESGDLWVNLYHEDFAHVHRLAYSLFDWQPASHEWEVFDREAVLVRHVTFPGAFDLRVIGDGEAFGFFTLDTGEIVVGKVDLTGSPVPAG